MKTLCQQIFVFAGIVILCGCSQKPQNKFSHPDYFDAVFRKADSLSPSQPEKAILFIDSAFNAFAKPGIIDLCRKYISNAHYFTYVKMNYDSSILYADSVLWVVRGHTTEELFEPHFELALFIKGYSLLQQRNYSGAFGCFYRARQAAERSGVPGQLIQYTSMLGFVNYKEGKYLEAARYTKLAYEEIGRTRVMDFKTRQSKLDDIGISYTRSGMPDSGLYYFNDALAGLAKTAQNPATTPADKLFVEMAKGVVLGNMGDALCAKGDTSAAEKAYIESIGINTKKDFDHGDAQVTKLKLAQLYFAKGELKETGQLLQQLRVSLDSLPDKEAELKWFALQLEYCDKIGQPKEAYQYMHPYLKLKDSLATAGKLPQVDISEEYEHIKAEYDLALLAKKDELKNIYLIAAVISAVMAAVIILLVWRNWNRSKKLNTKITKQNNELLFSLASLTESQKENTRLMNIVAHDLRNPIGSVVLVSEVLIGKGNLPSEDLEMLQLMKTSSQHSLEMISDLLNVNIVGEALAKEPVELHALLRYCVDLLQFKANEKKQNILLDVVNITVDINREKMWRVINNLIVNAIKFSPEGAVINVTAHAVQNGAQIEIRDYGIGIPVSLKAKIFEMFTEAKRQGTAGEQSFGLGLAISKQIIEAHGGKIWFESEEGLGTCFYIWLPM